MSLRLPGSPMEGLGIDVKKFASDASTLFSRAKQYTEEQLQLGQVEKTPLDPDVDVMFRRFQVMQVNLSKICDSMNALVQPNPNLRMEKLVLSKLGSINQKWASCESNKVIDSGNSLGRPQDLSGLESLGSSLLCSSAGAKESNEQLGAILEASGNAQIEISKAEKIYLDKAKECVIGPFKTFLENDAKTIFKEKGILETKRLDLDAAKAKLKKVKTLEGRDQQEKEVRNLQTDFERQQELLKLLLEGTSSHHSTQLRAYQEFIDAQVDYFAAAASHAKSLQANAQALLGSNGSNGFPRRDSQTKAVPVSDIIKTD
ncbi:Oidioi.mRNA.OKI2018_I69.XSR.g13730.t1.cds [Oikopleura dioica]|uniref:Oidioi.mRNA.OKI2018_I69.XSR.g13730.t1.cds n=1 Tax=Oikopleura dioica TaxID=34765 RepID=A0ABN7SG99_OIKDI|nr:Oidioi.mRNA.OKI2018_I69.XSR.g13730.t1.cds [Oikopleura dioica]